MKMDSFLLLTLTICCFNAFTCLYVRKQKKTAVDRDYLFLSAVYFCWLLLESLLSLPFSDNYLKIFFKVKIIFQFLHGIFFLKLVLSFINIKPTIPMIFWLLEVTVVATIFSFYGMDLSQVFMLQNIENPLEFMLALLGIVNLLLPAFIAFLLLLKEMIKEETIFKQQLDYILLAAGLVLIASILHVFNYKFSLFLAGINLGLVFVVMVKKKGLDVNDPINMEKNIDHQEKEEKVVLSEKMLRILAEVSLYLVNFTNNFSSAMQMVLTCLGEKCGVDYAYGIMLQKTDTGFIADKSYCWIQELSLCVAIDLEFSVLFRPWIETLSQGDMIDGNYDTISVEERVFLDQWKINSFLAIPVFSRKKFWGVIGFAMKDKKRLWSEEEKTLLNSIALRIGGVLSKKQDEEFLKRSVQKFEIFAKYTDGLIMEVTVEGHLTYISPTCSELLGYHSNELLKKNLKELVYPDDYEDVLVFYKKILKKGEPLQLNCRLKNKNGEWRRLAGEGFSYRTSAGQPRGILILRDDNYQGRIEDEIIKTEQFESHEMLVGSIAHDFKNMLSIIWGNVLLAKLNAEFEHEVVEKLSGIGKELLRAKNLSDKLLTFARFSQPEKQIVDLVEIINEAAFFIMLDKKIRFELKAEDDLWLIAADRSHLIQVFNNLFLNSVEAMNEGGVIRVWVENNTDEADEGKYVRIIIHDTGTGIPDYCLPQIFEPFFTTKPGKQGLGLTTVSSIIKNHGGKVFAQSKGGAVFHIYLPAVNAGAA